MTMEMDRSAMEVQNSSPDVNVNVNVNIDDGNIDYDDNNDNDDNNNDNNDNTNSSTLTVLQGIALLTADCMGVGILGLPNDMKVIGFSIGICFLLLNCPINYYAGNLLAIIASNIEENEENEEDGEDDGRAEERDDNDNDNNNGNDSKERDHQGDDDENDGIMTVTTKSTITKEIELTNTTNMNMNMNMNTNVDKTRRRINVFSNNNNNNNNNKRRNNWKGQRQRRRQSYKGLPLEQQEQEENEDQVNKKHKEYYDDNDDGSGRKSNERLNIDNDDDDNDNDDIADDIFQDEIIVIPDNNNQDYYNEENDINPEDDDNDNDKRKISKTSDLTNITEAVFSDQSNDNDSSSTDIYYIILVKILYYTNLFLVLGDYILVMGKSVMAVFGDSASASDNSGDNDNFVLCLPIASFIASILMFGLCQFRTMANIGKHVSMLSLLALFIVLIQCLFHHHYLNNFIEEDDDVMEEQGDAIITATATTPTTTTSSSSWNQKFSSLAGIGFAVGSNKLFLNIRNELNDRSQGSKVLAGSLTLYGFVYIIVILLAGSDPPSFLFDSIGDGYSRRIAGLLLWFHVAVSYAINSQALCKSIDGIITVHQRTRRIRNTRSNNNNNNSNNNSNNNNNFLSLIMIRLNNNVIDNPIHRWLCITLVVTISSYLVSNAIPFFKDLVGLIGALTSVPLCLSLPAILYRKYAKSKSKSKSNATITATSIVDESKSNINNAAAEVAVYQVQDQVQQSINNNDITNICRRFWSYCCSYSYLLLLYSFLFLIIGLIGSISSIEEDWLNQGRPFSCQ